jgi:murein L,D-transpeptidase YcbB/YkuD
VALTLVTAGQALALSPIQEKLSQTIESLTVPPVLGGEGLTDLDLITDFYTRREFRPAWVDQGKVDEMLALIERSASHGLRPEDYHGARLQALARQYRSTQNPDDALTVELDILLTDALARLGYHLHFGKVDPHTLDAHWNFSRELGGIEPVLKLQEAIDAASISAYGQDLFPQIPYYRRYREVLAQYRDIARNGGWPSIPAGPTLEPGATDARVPLLRQYLVTAGYLAADSPATGDTYDTGLLAAMMEFQRLHGLQADGRIGKGTLEALNVPVTARIDQIRVNMERVRWVFRDLEERFLIVNIAGGNAFGYDHGQRDWSGRAIVGKPYRATPIFKAEMTYLVLNPTWTVPPTILRQDVLPKVRNDASYLADHEMDVIDRNGRIVDPRGVQWQSVQAGSFPYSLRQRAGPKNPLGRIKFMFPNPYLVYLHDTSAPELFDRPAHTFSSGCIRVQNPVSLAEWVLKESNRWNAMSLGQEIDTGKTQTVLLETPLTVMLLYWTVAFDDDDKPIFLKDVYNRDAAVLRALDAPFRFEPLGSIGAGHAVEQPTEATS